MHLGSGARIQRVLNKALAGQIVTISVLGGSGITFFFPSFHTFQTQHTNDHAVSACHGAGDDPISPTCYPSCFFQWWNTVFPHRATELTNGALRRTKSGYFGYCNSLHFPDQTGLVSIELDTEDEPCVSFVSRLFLSCHLFLFASIAIGLLRRPCAHLFHTFLSSPKSHQARVAAHEAHPARLLIYPLPRLHHGFLSRPPFNPSPFPISQKHLAS